MEKEKSKNTNMEEKTTAKATEKVKVATKTSTTKTATKTSTAKTTKNNTVGSNVKSNKTESTDTKKKTTTKSKETKKAVAKNVPVQKKTVTKKSNSVKKSATKKDKDEEVNKEIKEQEELIEHVESVSEQAEIYKDLLEHNLLDENEEVSEELIDPKVIEKNTLETIKKELKSNKKSNNSKNRKQEKYKEIFKNSLIFIFIEIYFLILLISKSTIGTIEYITDLKLFSLIEMIVSVILFEISYKKENSKIAWHGIEMILLGATTIFILDLYSRQSSIIDTVFAIIAGAFILYYIIKMFIIALKKQK